MAIYYKVAKDKILGVLIFFYSRNENKYLLGNYGISTFAFYYFLEREREKIFENTGRNKEIGGKLWRKYCHESCDIRSGRGVGGGYSNVNGDQRGDTF